MFQFSRRVRTARSARGREAGAHVGPKPRRSGRITVEIWRALALQQLLAGEEVAEPGFLEGEADDRTLFAFYAIPPDADADDLAGLASRAIEAWLYISDEQ